MILAVFENDLRDLLKERNGTKKRPSSDTLAAVSDVLRTIGRNSALVNIANRLKIRIELAAAGIDARKGMHGGTGWAPPTGADEALAARYSAVFRDTVELLASRSIEFAVMFIPAADSMDREKSSAMEPVIRSATMATSTPYLDLTPIFRNQPDPVSRLYLLQYGPGGELVGDGHLSREGNAVAGRALAGWFVEKKLVP